MVPACRTLPIPRVAAWLAALALAVVGCETRCPLTATPASAGPRSPSGAPPIGSAPVAASQAPSDDGDAPPPPSWPLEPRPVPLPDQGIYPDLDGQVRLAFPAWLAGGPVDIVVPSGASSFAVVGGVPVAFATGSARTAIRIVDRPARDLDRDGIPNQLDILIGGKKAALAAAPYRETYRQIPYPGGDIPRDEGVCTDVVIRALRNAGIDLQKEIREDAGRRPEAYAGIRKPDPNIDHRRVRNLVPYFKRFWAQLPTDPDDSGAPWIPGDIVFLDTMKDPQPDHLGVVSDHTGPSGRPLIINSWTTGYSTSEMDLLSFVPVTHRFRVPEAAFELPPERRGLQGILERSGLALGSAHRQVVLVTTPMWQSSAGTLRRYEREQDGSWRRVGSPVPVRLGASGLARGAGVEKPAPGPLAWLGRKSEGDRKSPAGIFTFGTAFGRAAANPVPGSSWPWRATDPLDRWVDDPGSPHYNTWQRASGAAQDAGWRSAETLADYDLAIVVRHNDTPIRPGAGSAIFLHSWAPQNPTAGCTGLLSADLHAALAWLRADANPVLVQVAGWMVD